MFNGELPANQYGGACNLGSLVLPNFVENPFTDRAAVNMTLLTSTIESAVKMLDNIIDINTFPSPIYENYQKTFRTIGLGFTGLGDMLAMMGLAYNSEHGSLRADV